MKLVIVGEGLDAQVAVEREGMTITDPFYDESCIHHVDPERYYGVPWKVAYAMTYFNEALHNAELEYS